MAYEPIATGNVDYVTVNGAPERGIFFGLDGPFGDRHCGSTRLLSGHDSDYIRTSSLVKGDTVFNWRTWTALSSEEVQEVERTLGVVIPRGTLLENLEISGIPDFSKLPPASRLVFPARKGKGQAILAVWSENGPCKTVGQRLADHHEHFELMAEFVAAAEGKRGVMGFVLSPGIVRVGDTVLVYPPA